MLSTLTESTRIKFTQNNIALRYFNNTMHKEITLHLLVGLAPLGAAV